MSRCRVATFNMKNLFLPGGSVGQPAIQGALPKRRAELRALARALQLADADVVALQEVGSITALEAVNQLLAEPYPHLLMLPGNSARGIHLAYASRVPANVVSHRELRLLDDAGRELEDHTSVDDAAAGQMSPLKLQRDLVRLDCELQDRPAATQLTLFNVHLKSPNQPAWARLSAQDLRCAECRLIARVVSDFAVRYPRAAIVILGDFNAEWQAAALEPLRQAGFSCADGALSASLPASFWSLGLTIDHILVNAIAAERIVTGSLNVINDKRCRRGSDHAPVLVDLAL